MGCGGSKAEAPAAPAAAGANSPTMVKVQPPAAAPSAGEALPPKRLEKVRALFQEWDVDGNGMIPLSTLNGATTSVGPTEVKVLAQLADMDFNGDGFVEASEWEEYFTATAGGLTDQQFDAIIEDLTTSGRCARRAFSALSAALCPLARRRLSSPAAR